MNTTTTIAISIAVAATCLPAAGQVTGDELQAMADKAATMARETNMTAAVMIDEGTIVRLDHGQTVTIRSHVFLTTRSGVDRSWRIVADPRDGQTIVRFTGDSFAAGIRGVEIRCRSTVVAGVTAIRFDGGCKNPLLENCRVDMWRLQDCIALDLAARESATVRRLTARASVPVRIKGGDNHHLSDLDLTAATTPEHREAMHALLPSTCVWIDAMPNQWTLDGSFTAQGGDHAIFGRVASQKTGQVLRIEGLRYEQSLSRSSNADRAVDLVFSERPLERLVLIGCRWTDRQKGLYATGVRSVTRIGSRLPGTYWHRAGMATQ